MSTFAGMTVKFDNLAIVLMKLNLYNYMSNDLGNIARLAAQCNIKPNRISNEEKDIGECQI